MSQRYDSLLLCHDIQCFPTFKLLVVIFCSLVELEDSKADKGEMSRILKAKETKILSQQAKIDDHENRIVQLENE